MLWINRFDAGTRQWGEPAMLNVTGGEDRRFVKSLSSQGSSSFSVSMAMGIDERPVALITEAILPGWIGAWSRSWVTRSLASSDERA
ncbi:hypothetical protein [Ottowia thiooxydans]|uniref:hypothetical protein n=1 Tax=Ottowia thiooxydans TaxID=219182 RepID=UPI0004062D92|nr:hypothetical protein [Ottowia thiooxydans]